MTKGEETRLAILEQASRVASRVGLTGLTIGNLASKAGLSKSGLYAHFDSKEALQSATLAHATTGFIDNVLRPALSAPRGEPRLRALFDRWLRWCAGESLPGGCLMFAAATEMDDQPGLVRDQLVRSQHDMLEAVAQIFRTGVAETQFHADSEPEQFAYDLYGVMLAYSHAYRLMRDPAAEHRARKAFENLLAAARNPQHPSRKH